MFWEYDLEWSQCSATCGGGTQTKNFIITTEASNGGEECSEGPLIQACNTSPCPVDCDGSWGEWSTCTKSCDDGSGPGTRTRNYNVSIEASNGGSPCTSNGNTVENGDIEEEACNPSPCPVDCDGSWETGRRIKPCDDGSGPGTRTRNYNVSIEASNGGSPCTSKRKYC